MAMTRTEGLAHTETLVIKILIGGTKSIVGRMGKRGTGKTEKGAVSRGSISETTKAETTSRGITSKNTDITKAGNGSIRTGIESIRYRITKSGTPKVKEEI